MRLNSISCHYLAGLSEYHNVLLQRVIVAGTMPLSYLSDHPAYLLNLGVNEEGQDREPRHARCKVRGRGEGLFRSGALLWLTFDRDCLETGSIFARSL